MASICFFPLLVNVELITALCTRRPVAKWAFNKAVTFLLSRARSAPSFVLPLSKTLEYAALEHLGYTIGENERCPIYQGQWQDRHTLPFWKGYGSSVCYLDIEEAIQPALRNSLSTQSYDLPQIIWTTITEHNRQRLRETLRRWVKHPPHTPHGERPILPETIFTRFPTLVADMELPPALRSERALIVARSANMEEFEKVIVDGWLDLKTFRLRSCGWISLRAKTRILVENGFDLETSDYLDILQVAELEVMEDLLLDVWWKSVHFSFQDPAIVIRIIIALKKRTTPRDRWAKEISVVGLLLCIHARDRQKLFTATLVKVLENTLYDGLLEVDYSDLSNVHSQMEKLVGARLEMEKKGVIERQRKAAEKQKQIVKAREMAMEDACAEAEAQYDVVADLIHDEMDDFIVDDDQESYSDEDDGYLDDTDSSGDDAFTADSGNIVSGTVLKSGAAPPAEVEEEGYDSAGWGGSLALDSDDDSDAPIPLPRTKSVMVISDDETQETNPARKEGHTPADSDDDMPNIAPRTKRLRVVSDDEDDMGVVIHSHKEEGLKKIRSRVEKFGSVGEGGFGGGGSPSKRRSLVRKGE